MFVATNRLVMGCGWVEWSYACKDCPTYCQMLGLFSGHSPLKGSGPLTAAQALCPLQYWLEVYKTALTPTPPYTPRNISHNICCLTVCCAGAASPAVPSGGVQDWGVRLGCAELGHCGGGQPGVLHDRAHHEVRVCMCMCVLCCAQAHARMHVCMHMHIHMDMHMQVPMHTFVTWSTSAQPVQCVWW